MVAPAASEPTTRSVVATRAHLVRWKGVEKRIARPTCSCAQACSTSSSAPFDRVKTASRRTYVPATQKSSRNTCELSEAKAHSLSQ